MVAVAKRPLSIGLIQFRTNAERLVQEWQEFQRFNTELYVFRPWNAAEGGGCPTWLEHMDAYIFAGSPASVDDGDAVGMVDLVRLLTRTKERQTPTLGICFGAQLMAQVFGGLVEHPSECAEHGTYPIWTLASAKNDHVFGTVHGQDFPERFWAQCSHDDAIVELPLDAKVLAVSQRCFIHAFRLDDCPMWGVQYHPERTYNDFLTVLRYKRQQARSGVERQTIDQVVARLRESTYADLAIRRFLAEAERVTCGTSVW